MKKLKCEGEDLLESLPECMLGVILGKVAQESHIDWAACKVTCKTFEKISDYPDVLKNLKLEDLFPTPWNRIPEAYDLICKCAKAGNVFALFSCGLINYYYKKDITTALSQLSMAAKANLPEAMYLYGMILINEGELAEGTKYVKKVWKELGFETVRSCQQNCREVILELSVRQYREYDMLLTQLEVGDDCVTGDFNEVCESCFIYKEIFRFIDYMHYV